MNDLPCKHEAAQAVGWWDGKEGKKTVRGRTFYCSSCGCVIYRPHDFKGELHELEACDDETAKLIDGLLNKHGAS